MSILSKVRAPVNLVGRSRTWLDDQIARSQKGFFIEIVDITPDLAEEMLARNIRRNRQIRAKVVEQYAQAMTEGRWVTTAQGISFDKTGNLDNGQHRLSAIIKSGVTVRMAVAFGHEADTYTILDAGARRGPADALRASGLTNENIAAAVIVRVAMISEGIYNRNVPYGHDEIVEWALTDPYLSEAAGMGDQLGKALKATGSGFGLGAYYIIASKHHGPASRAFFEKLKTGVGITGPRDPARFVREDAMKGKYRGYNGIFAAAADMIIAFNCNLTKERFGRPGWDQSQPFPTVSE